MVAVCADWVWFCVLGVYVLHLVLLDETAYEGLHIRIAFLLLLFSRLHGLWFIDGYGRVSYGIYFCQAYIWVLFPLHPSSPHFLKQETNKPNTGISKRTENPHFS